uniref:C2H2-type domain-containing protein n=1 Tax=Globodera rostochiensis TaxID=31243 RepID=A0A914H7Q9_GLORO
MKEFPTKDPSEFTKEEIMQILLLEKKKDKTTLFYKPKKDSMPEICVPYYNKEGNEAEAYSNGQIKKFVICKNNDCNTVLKCPSGSINAHYEGHKSRKRPYDATTSSKLSAFFPQQLSGAEKSQFSQMLAEYCIESGSSFRSAASPPMRNLLSKAVNFGVKYGKSVGQQIELPCRKTINRRAYELADEILSEKKDNTIFWVRSSIGTIRTGITSPHSQMVDAALAIINAAKSVGIFVRNHGWLRKEVEFVPQEEVVTRWLRLHHPWKILEEERENAAIFVASSWKCACATSEFFGN